MRFALIVVACLLYFPASAYAWWNSEWNKRVAVTVSVPAQTPAPPAQELTVLVKLHAGNFPDFFLLNENLSDLRFIAADDKTPLKHHVDSFDLVNQQLLVWVRVGNLAPGAPQKVWMYYGNEKAVPAADAPGTFDPTLAAAIHFASKPAASWTDVTAYNAATTLEGGEVTPASIIGSGLKLGDKTRFSIQESPSNHFDSSTGFGFSAWIKPGDLTSTKIIMQRKGATDLLRPDNTANNLALGISATGINVDLFIDGTAKSIKVETPIEAAKWHHVALVVNQNNLSIFYNGALLKSEAISRVALTSAISLGGGSATTAFVGELDEIRISQTPPSTLAILTDAKNQGPIDEVTSVGAPEETSSESANAEAGLFEVTLRSMDEAGWIVTIILLVMAFITWIVMIGKFLYLVRVDKDNKSFTKEFVKLLEKDDPAALDKDIIVDEDAAELDASPIAQALFGKHDHFQSSPLYRLYHRGITEIRGRATLIQATGLTERSNQAIRASLDAQTVREAQRLQSQMIFLTIGISGGPFVGLFGTVMGVMITFAAIAATGDVNISAIAPGVAAALLTTLAGLFVAIPALFGYNYLYSRIKANIADMRVFSDEFATRLAEYYGR